MKAAKVSLYAGLKASTALAAIVSTRITDAWPATTAVFPCVSYLQVSGLGEVADGRTIGFDEVFQVSLFAKTSAELENMAAAVLDVADSLGMTMTGNQDLLFDETTGIKHKPLRFRYITRR